ncbi:hypothetical protein BN1723_001246 [Verticillium longisporum]|uniref:Uncharacterized protein n=1 Tax=Verticillium longisporum TaxID=100787 RepID=A0A0G4NKQ5_VERLO|nr:hypothetical protein BN1723_001246 [Verticillium longisporum]
MNDRSIPRFNPAPEQVGMHEDDMSYKDKLDQKAFEARQPEEANDGVMHPIIEKVVEYCWSLLHPGTRSIFTSAAFPTADDTAALLQPRKQTCAIQVNGKVRGVVQIPKPPAGLAGDALRDWMVAEVFKTEEGQTKFSSGPWDVRSPKRVIVARGAKTVNFVV